MNIKICNKCNQEKLVDEFHKDKSKKDGVRSHCKNCISEYLKKYLIIHKKQKKQYFKNYYQNHKLEYKQRNQKHRQERNQYQKNKCKADIDYKIALNLRIRLNQVLKGNYKSESITNLLGCSLENLKQHLENQFKSNMSFLNYGLWHIDHIKPCASFDLSKPNEQRKCFHYTNLQPLWAEENLSKGKSVL